MTVRLAPVLTPTVRDERPSRAAREAKDRGKGAEYRAFPEFSFRVKRRGGFSVIRERGLVTVITPDKETSQIIAGEIYRVEGVDTILVTASRYVCVVSTSKTTLKAIQERIVAQLQRVALEAEVAGEPILFYVLA